MGADPAGARLVLAWMRWAGDRLVGRDEARTRLAEGVRGRRIAGEVAERLRLPPRVDPRRRVERRTEGDHRKEAERPRAEGPRMVEGHVAVPRDRLKPSGETLSEVCEWEKVVRADRIGSDQIGNSDADDESRKRY